MRFQRTALFVCFAVWLVPCRAKAQQGEPQITDWQRDEAHQMLDVISDDIKNQYYDPKLHGVDWAANVKTYRQKIDTAPTLNYALSEVAAGSLPIAVMRSASARSSARSCSFAA